MFVEFQEKLRKLIDQLFLPEENEEIALEVLQEALGQEEIVDSDVNKDNSADDMQVDKQAQPTRRKSFSDGLCARTQKTRFAELDQKISSGISLQQSGVDFHYVEEDADLVFAWHENRLTNNDRTILGIGTFLLMTSELDHL